MFDIRIDGETVASEEAMMTAINVATGVAKRHPEARVTVTDRELRLIWESRKAA